MSSVLKMSDVVLACLQMAWSRYLSFTPSAHERFLARMKSSKYRDITASVEKGKRKLLDTGYFRVK